MYMPIPSSQASLQARTNQFVSNVTIKGKVISDLTQRWEEVGVLEDGDKVMVDMVGFRESRSSIAESDI